VYLQNVGNQYFTVNFEVMQNLREFSDVGHIAPFCAPILPGWDIMTRSGFDGIWMDKMVNRQDARDAKKF
jgi:hypothetical protein